MDGGWGSRTLQVVLASTLVGVMGVTLVSPVLPAVRSAFGLTDAAASLLITAYTLPGIVLSPVAGSLADRFGRRRVLVPSLVVFSVAGTAVVLAGEFGTVLVLRGLQGAGAAGLFNVAVVLLTDVFEGARRTPALGITAPSAPASTR